jgi:hypothetical protein
MGAKEAKIGEAIALIAQRVTPLESIPRGRGGANSSGDELILRC